MPQLPADLFDDICRLSPYAAQGRARGIAHARFEQLAHLSQILYGIGMRLPVDHPPG